MWLLDEPDFNEALSLLKSPSNTIIAIETIVMIPEADIIVCSYRKKRLRLKFDLAYGLFIEPLDELTPGELSEIERLLSRRSQ